MDPYDRLNKKTTPTMDASAQKFIDRLFVEETGLPSIVLMEQAAGAVSRLILDLCQSDQRVLFLAGAGNNGGDAWASARQLMAHAYDVTVVDLFPYSDLPPDANQNKRAYLALGGHRITDDSIDLSSYAVIVDGIMGTGFRLSRPLSKDILSLLSSINERDGVLRIAIDIPTGIEADTGACDQVVFQADHTVTFSAVKIGLMAEPGCSFCGQIICHPISMASQWLESVLERYQKQNTLLPRVLTGETFIDLDLSRATLSHKGCHGKTLLIGGSAGMTGAVVLLTRAAQATGVGYAYVRTIKQLIPQLLSASPESLIDEIPGSIDDWHQLIDRVDSVALGPGSGRAGWMGQSIEPLIQRAVQLVIDADGLNHLASIKDWCNLLSSRQSRGLFPAILTPHPGEFMRLAPDLAELLDRDRQAAAVQLAVRSGSIIVLKGHVTVIALPTGQTFLNTSGNPSLARAGSGDVLTGLAAGFLAQLPDPIEAITLAVYFHGLLADIAVEHLGQHGVTPSKLLDYAAQAFDRLTSTRRSVRSSAGCHYD